MGNQMIILLVIGGLLGLFGGNAMSKLNPFKTRRVAVVKQEMQREEYFRDKVKKIEYRITERSKNQSPVNAGTSIGAKVGMFIDNSLKLIIIFFIFGMVVLFLTGINIFKFIKNILVQLNSTRKALKQTVDGIEVAKPKLNGEHKTLKVELSKKQDEDTKLIIDKIKHGQE